jgi:hypothetical protein
MGDREDQLAPSVGEQPVAGAGGSADLPGIGELLALLGDPSEPVGVADGLTLEGLAAMSAAWQREAVEQRVAAGRRRGGQRRRSWPFGWRPVAKGDRPPCPDYAAPSFSSSGTGLCVRNGACGKSSKTCYRGEPCFCPRCTDGSGCGRWVGQVEKFRERHFLGRPAWAGQRPLPMRVCATCRCRDNYAGKMGGCPKCGQS